MNDWLPVPGFDQPARALADLTGKRKGPAPFGTGPYASESRHGAPGMGMEAPNALAVFPLASSKACVVNLQSDGKQAHEERP